MESEDQVLKDRLAELSGYLLANLFFNQCRCGSHGNSETAFHSH